MSEPLLSLVVIAKNETTDLPRCLESVRGLAEDVVVVVNDDSDPTGPLAESLGARVFRRAFDGYGPQKRFAVSLARGVWVLNLDADERLIDRSREEIRALLRGRPAFDAYSLRTECEFLGRICRHGGLGEERKVRLFRRGAADFNDKVVHESVETAGPIGALRHPISHRPYASLSEYLAKFDNYTTLDAQAAHAAGERASAWDHARLPLVFLKKYFLQLGCLDGGPGFAWSALSAGYSWFKKLKLRELEKAS